MDYMKNVLKVLLWGIALILFPIAAGLYFIWPGRIFKDRISLVWNRFWWGIYTLVAVPCVIWKLVLCFCFIAMLIEGEGFSPSVSRDDIEAPEYRTSKDFRKLTGVEFPEL